MLRSAPLLRPLYLLAGFISVTLGTVGAFLPLLPSVPFFILAAFCFGRSDPRLERWLLDHSVVGPSIRLWREKGAISRKGKLAASAAFVFSIGMALWLSPMPWSLVAVAVMLMSGAWIWTRPEA
ncbi:MAG: YbaN family protein [Caulobacterales bacterium]